MTVTVSNGRFRGDITIRSPGSTSISKVTGTIQGDTIKFGAIINAPVTFTGKLVGDRTLGTYKATNGSDHGTWSAVRG